MCCSGCVSVMSLCSHRVARHEPIGLLDSHIMSNDSSCDKVKLMGPDLLALARKVP